MLSRILRITLFTGALLLGVSSGLTAQKTSIRVIDATDKQPVPFCHICLENKQSGDQEYFVGDILGKAEVPVNGETILSVSSIGYQHYFDTIAPGTGSVEVLLEPNYFDLDEVVVTGQYKPVTVDKSIYDIKVIGKTKIENQAANTMADLLSKELNFKINNDPSTGSSLSLQGISGENVKILVDGVPVIGRLNGNIDLSQINLENVDHVEIVEGPMSVIYGSNALAGVLNIITKDNKYARLMAGIHGYYESVGIYNLNGNLDTHFGNHSLNFTGGRNFFGGYGLVDSLRSQEWKPKEQYNAGIKYGYEKKGIKAGVKSDFFKENLLDRNNPAPPYYEKANDTWFHTLRFNNSVQLNARLSEADDLQFLTAYSYYDRRKIKYLKDLTTLDRVLVTNPEEHDTSTFHAIAARGGFNHGPEAGKLDFHAGYDINTEWGKGKRIRNGQEFIGDYALFASMQWHPDEQFSFQPAVRVSYNTRYKSPVVPSLNIMYRPGNTTFRASYARGFRAPSLKELYLNFYDSNHQIEGNENLKAERSHNFNLIVSHAEQVGRNRVEIKLKGFYNIINDRISLIQVDPDNPLYYKNANTDHFESLGGDLTVHAHPHRLVSMEAGVSYIGRQDSYYETDDFVFSTSAIGNLTAKLWKNRASVSVYYKYSGKYPVHTFITDDQVALTYLDPFHNVDLTFTVKFFRQRLQLSTGVKNLLDYTQLSGLSGGTGHGDGQGISSLVGWGRTGFLSVKYNLIKY